MNAIEVKLRQGTPEWKEWRHRGIGGSDAPVIEGTSPYQTIRDLFFEKSTGQSFNDDSSKEFIFAKGHKVEALIREQFQDHLGVEILPICYQHRKYDYLRASLDGFDPKHGVLEAKLVGKAVLEKAAETGDIPPFHYTQLQHQFMVTGADVGNWFGHDGKKRGIVVPITANKKFIKALEEKEHKFWDDVTNNVVPPLSERDYLIPEDLSLLESLREAKEQAENAKAEYEALKEKAVAAYKHPRIAGAGIKLFKVTRDGSLNIKAIPEIERALSKLKPDYLEKFRGRSSESWSIRIEGGKQ